MKPSSVALLVGAFLLFPLIMTHPYYMHLTNLILIFTLTATGLNIVTGYAGQLSLGHAAFFAIGAYSSALLSMKMAWSFPLALVGSAFIATGFGAVLGIPSLRLRGPYLALATAGFSEIIRIIINNWESLTQGSRGIPEIPGPSFLRLRSSIPPWRRHVNALAAFDESMLQNQSRRADDFCHGRQV